MIKVCGITDNQNLQELCELGIDMIGINGYPSSKRFIGEKILDDCTAKRVGVFVNAQVDEIENFILQHKLDLVQLHGDESVKRCKEVQRLIPIIKVFRIDEDFKWVAVNDYDFADYFLFDTKTSLFGGSGKQFDWSILQGYNMKIPFFISGGIGPNDAAQILSFQHKYFIGVDINSRFETAPGIKDTNLVKKFIEEIRH